MEKEPKLVSIVAPAFNEAPALGSFLEALRAALAPLEGRFRFEIVVVDDGSKDATAEVMAKECAKDPRLSYVKLSRNFGHQAALTAGLAAAKGACVISLDADLQHPPSLIPEMLARWEQGIDVVDTRRLATAQASAFKEFTSRRFYALLARATGLPLMEGAADFRLLDRQVVLVLLLLPETRRFYRGLIPWLGFSRHTLEYVASARVAGESKFTLKKMLRLAADGLFGFSNVPLRFATLLGALALLAGLVYTIYALVQALVLGHVVPGWTSTLITIIFFSGVNLLILGILGEYIGRIFDQVKGRPMFVVDRRHSIPGRERGPEEPPPPS